MEISRKLKIPRPAKELRDQVRRDQIIDAARKCVVRHGFHAASMAEIADTAQMSVGQIYRYFPNKEAIIHAIVQRIVDQRLKFMASSSEQPKDLSVFLSRRFLLGGEDENREDRILMLEVSAEATRNPVVANIAKEADRTLRTEAVATVRRNHSHLSEREATACVEFFSALAEGSTLRRFSGMELINEAATLDLYRHIIATVLNGTQASLSTQHH